jgi:hypothetical protein
LDELVVSVGSLSEAARMLGLDRANLHRLRKGSHLPVPETIAEICRRLPDNKAARDVADAYLRDIEEILRASSERSPNA